MPNHSGMRDTRIWIASDPDPMPENWVLCVSVEEPHAVPPEDLLRDGRCKECVTLNIPVAPEHINRVPRLTTVLTNAQVIELRERAMSGVTATQLAKDYKISSHHASDIARGLYYQKVGGPISKSLRRRPAGPKGLSPTRYAELDARVASAFNSNGSLQYGASTTVAEEFGITSRQVLEVAKRLRRNKRYGLEKSR